MSFVNDISPAAPVPPLAPQRTSTAAGLTPLDRRLSVAPMMGWTDRHYRYMARLISPSALLYTVMITTGALIYGKQFRVLDFDKAEHPVALQLGGSDPAELATCAKFAKEWGYDEVNLNCGCPSDRVQKGQFGACLMLSPALVADCVKAMRDAVDLPVTVKTRIGVDNEDSYDFVRDFVGTVHEKGGCDVFIIHARKAWLNGLSPKDNRTIPPLNYDTVYRLKRDFPHLTLVLNGGLTDTAQVMDAMPHVDGVMIGRAAYQTPYFLAALEQAIFGTETLMPETDVVAAMQDYTARMMAETGMPLKDVTRHLLGLFQGQPGARGWRRVLSEDAYRDGADIDVITRALAKLSARPPIAA